MGGTVYLYDGNALIGSAACSSSGIIISASSALAAGAHTVVAVQSGVSGLSSESNAVAFTLTAPSSGSGGSSGSSFTGGGGGAVYAAPSGTSNAALNAARRLALACQQGDRFNTLTGETCVNSSVASGSLSGTGPLGAPSGTQYHFTVNSSIGSRTSQVLNLQRFLNARGFAIAKAGAGSIGHETTYFGPATRAALARFQKAIGIKPAVGYFGPITRAYLNRLLTGSK